jgi:Mg-chelatase subunit ChlD
MTSLKLFTAVALLATVAQGALLGASAGSRQAQAQAQARVEVAFVLDTTGSMADLIDGAKRKIWSIASTIVDDNPDADIAMALVAYRDKGDVYVVKTSPLSEDIQGLYGDLIKLEADGGDDTPESVNKALDTAISKLEWTSGDNVHRIVFLVGDAPPHMDYAQERQYPAILKDAVQRDIVVNAVQAGDMTETTDIWKEIAQYGRGSYVTIPQSGGEVVVIISPYDDDILHLQRELDSTVIPYGDDKVQGMIRRKMTEKAASAPSTQLENSEFYAKRKKTKEVVTGGGDLLSDVRNNRLDLDQVKDAELPEELRKQSKAERSAWINDRLAKRNEIEEKISALVVKRDAFVRKETEKRISSKDGDSFDEAVRRMLKTQLN